jgi:hypothetical protein
MTPEPSREERVQRSDAKLRAAFRDVPVPEGLAQRLVERLRAARVEAVPLAGVADSIATPVDALAPAARTRPPRGSRRWLLVAAGVCTTAAALLVAAILGWGESKPYNRSLVLQEATDWFQRESPESQWNTAAPPAAYPCSRDVQSVPRQRWQEVRGLLGAGGVAYELTRPGGPRAVLFVVRQTVPGLPAQQPPNTPTSTTGGCAASAWQDGDLVYVLVVEGGPTAYEKYLRPSGPLT